MDAAPALEAPSRARRVLAGPGSRGARRAAGALLVVAALTGAAGCTYTNPQTTLKPYIPADGQDQSLGSDVRVAALLVIIDAEGEPGTLLGRVVNGGNDPRTVQVTGDGLDESVTVPAGETFSFGLLPGQQEGASARTVVLPAVAAAPGTSIPLTFTVDDGTPVEVPAPVLTGALPQYAPYVPTPSPTTTPVPVTPPTSTLPPEGGATPGDGASASSTGGTTGTGEGTPEPSTSATPATPTGGGAALQG